MKTTIFRKKRFVHSLLLLAVFLFVATEQPNKVFASAITSPIISTTPLTEMDDLELVSFVLQNGIDVPDDLVDSVEFGIAIKDIIQASPRSSYSFSITQDIREGIQDLISIYQENSQTFLENGVSKSDHSFIMSVPSHTLENNLVMYNGLWSSSGGDWSNAYLNYNCYSFAINKTNERYRYPGQHSGVSMVYNYMSLYSISQMASFVKNDLDALGGYGDVYVYSSEPTEIHAWQTLICIRKGSSDYHFMKYDKSSPAWHHKPGGTAPLKYLHQPEDMTWVTEYSVQGICYNAEDQLAMGNSLTTYNSGVYYIVYGEQPFTTNISGLPSNQIAITGVKANVTLSGYISIPESLNGRTVTQIGGSAFSGQNQLTQITIPSTVTTIGANAFNNTNNARIDLEGRTTSPSTFNASWNSSNNPVYLSGVRCYHTSRTLASINSTTHGERCDKCRTTINITSHAYTNYIWKNYNQHSTTCGCGAFKLQGHAVASGDPGNPYKTCLHCGGPAQYGFVQLGGRIPMISLVPILFIQEYFGNGSYLLSNGIYVISDEDLDGFYDGTLILPESCDDCHEHFDSNDCEHCTTDCLDCNSYNYEDNLAYSKISKTHYMVDKKEELFELEFLS